MKRQEEVEVTRCICGDEEYQGEDNENEDPGFYLSCDECHVWQHGICVGIPNEKSAPDVYYCERCHPELHELTSSRTSQYRSRKRQDSLASVSTTPKLSPPAKRRLTMNSRDADYEVILQQVLEESARDDLEKKHVSPMEQTEQTLLDAAIITMSGGESRGLKRQFDDGDSSTSKRTRASAHASDAESEEGGDPVHMEVPEVEPDGEEVTNERPKPRRKGRRGRRVRRGPTIGNDELAARKRRKKDAAEPTAIDRPCKPRVLTARTSMGEMRKRVAAILEFIGRTQIEMAAANDEENGSYASIPMMEELTRELLHWEQRYGRYGKRG